MTKYLVTVVVCVCLVPPVVEAQTPDERASARGLVAKYGDAVVTVLGTAKVRINQGGREQSRDQRLQATATIIDPSGLAVMSLATIDPSDLLMADAARRPAGSPALTVNAETSDLRYRMADGREVPARVVLRDKDLDLAFLRPVDKQSAPLVAMDVAAAKPQPIDLLVVLQRLPEVAGWQAMAQFATVQAIVDKPRMFYLVTSSALGAPVFDTGGRFVGIVVRLRNDSGEGPTAPPIVLPAADIREVAKQAA